jgi:hypothetical protein
LRPCMTPSGRAAIWAATACPSITSTPHIRDNGHCWPLKLGDNIGACRPSLALHEAKHCGLRATANARSAAQFATPPGVLSFIKHPGLGDGAFRLEN